MRATRIFVMVLAVISGGVLVRAETHSDFNKEYNLNGLRTFDFKQQNRISSDPIANNQIWADSIRSAITANLTAHGMVQGAGAEDPDFLVAYYVGLKQRYDVRSMGYGVPFYGRGFNRWWGWPRGYDAWAAVPYDQSTLIIDLVDARTNQLVWRGYNKDSINLGKPDKDFADAVGDVLKKFYSDARKSGSKAT